MGVSGRSYMAVLSSTSSGLRPLSVSLLDLLPVAVGSELANSGEEMRTPVNCVELAHVHTHLSSTIN